ncbi:MAG: hypothetical protein C7B44_06580 [Sulfobacillus thermosulfidooxidans]|uniref:hypothetical protein n=1 Tax=Sulfobacillus sp. hq2 TaxID=2039167 RepID=UPI000CD20C4B|nr:hypothetical protein [Sulfobacillus sp. hq2]POB10791.1 hypothetical protein CO251_08240 [Sulfobacillus sp. hq2]PSR36888.1 MAG: hypothetical protein C7B44_06580 [Sulfobacillus thermosulfidooxidans]
MMAKRGHQLLGVGGIDAAKDEHYVQWLDTNERPAGKPFQFANTRAECKAVRIGMVSAAT